MNSLFKWESIRTDNLSKLKRYCKHCGHSVIVRNKKKICNWCGKFVFIDNKTEFEYRLSSEMKKRK